MFGIYPKSFAVLQEIFSKHSNVSEVKIYGSRAKGNYREGSDIDLVITNSIEYTELLAIMEEMEESTIPYLVDISIYEKLNSDSLKDHINRVGKLFYENK
jgi:uncharacterized protein